MTHYDDDALIRYTLAEELDSALSLHVSHCQACRERLAALAKTDAALRDPKTWGEVDARFRQSRRLAEFREIKSAMEAEHEAAHRLLRNALRSPLVFRERHVRVYLELLPDRPNVAFTPLQ